MKVRSSPTDFMKIPIKTDYDEVNDILTVDGKKFSGDFFRNLTSVTPEGHCFRVTEVEENGPTTVIVQKHVYFS